MSVAIGYMPGAYGQGGDDPTFLRRLVEVGDAHGYDSIWLSDRVVGERFSLEPMMALSMVAVLCAVQFALYGALVARVPRRGLGVVAVCLLHLMGMFLLSSL